MVSGPELEDKLSKSLSTLYVKAVDESDGCGAKFLIVVVSEAFNGKNKIAQHRLVHSAIAEEREDIHALTLKTFSSMADLEASEFKP